MPRYIRTRNPKEGVLLRLVDSSIPVVVLNLVGSAMQHGALSIVRSLGRLGVPVYSIHNDSSAVTSSRYMHRALTWSIDRSSAEDTVDYLLELGSTIGRHSILIPTDDVGTTLVEDNAERLRERFLFPRQPPGLARSLSSKKEMYYLCKEMGVATPAAVFPESRGDVLKFLEDAIFPVVVKGIDAWLIHRSVQATGVKSVVITKNSAELLEIYDAAEVLGRPNLLLQEYIPGGMETVWMFNGYFDDRSDSLVGFTGRKLRQHPPYTGFTTLGECLRNDTVERTTTEFMKKLGYKGVLDIGYRFDARDGQYKLLDVNPRVGGTFRLFVGANGMDVVRALYLDLSGQQVPSTTHTEGRKWIVENYDTLSCWRYYRDGRLGFREWLRSLRGIRETAWFAFDDPLPLLKMCRRSLAKLMRRVLHR